MYKISFCMVAMNRLHHVKDTLPVNINDNIDYPDIEFILLDYNSEDGLKEYVKNNMQEYIKRGKLVYYRTETPAFFKRSHSRNVSMKLATGTLLCNLDVDNYTGKGFAHHINDVFEKEEKVFLSTIGTQNRRDNLGRVCVRKSDYLSINGYDERMINYGFEDYDLVNRLELKGLKKVAFDEKFYGTKVLAHEYDDRFSNEYVSRNLIMILVRHISPSSSELLFLFKDRIYVSHIILDHETYHYNNPLSELESSELAYQLTLVEGPFAKGTWTGRDSSNEIILESSGLTLRLNSDEGCYTINHPAGDRYFEITDVELVRELIKLFSLIPNRQIMSANKLLGRDMVNEGGFGKETVYKNFSETPIAIA